MVTDLDFENQNLGMIRAGGGNDIRTSACWGALEKHGMELTMIEWIVLDGR